MKKLKHEAELVRQALTVGAAYFEKRGAGKFEATDSASNKVTAKTLVVIVNTDTMRAT